MDRLRKQRAHALNPTTPRASHVALQILQPMPANYILEHVLLLIAQRATSSRCSDSTKGPLLRQLRPWRDFPGACTVSQRQAIRGADVTLSAFGTMKIQSIDRNHAVFISTLLPAERFLHVRVR